MNISADRIISLLTLTAFLGSSPSALAQDGSPDSIDHEERRSTLSLQIEPYGLYGLESDLDGGGDVSVQRIGARLGLTARVNDAWTVGLNLNEEFSFTDFDAAAGLGGGDPFDTFTRLEFIPSATWATSDGGWSVTFGPRIELASESGADSGDSVLAGGFVIARRRFNESFSFGLGVSVSSRFEDSVRIVPLPSIDWRVNDKVRLYTERIGLHIEATISEQWSLTFKGRYEPREFRLDDSASAPLPDGVLRDESVLLGVELMWRPRPWITAAVEIGGIVHQDYEMLNSSGDDVFDDNADPSFFVAGRVVLRF